MVIRPSQVMTHFTGGFPIFPRKSHNRKKREKRESLKRYIFENALTFPFGKSWKPYNFQKFQK